MTRRSQSPGTGPNAQPADHPPPAQEGAARHKRAWPCQQTPRQRRSVPTPSQRPARRQTRHAPARMPAIRVATHAPAPTSKAAPSTDKSRPITDIIETAAASHADAPRRYQLNAVPKARAVPRPLQPALVPASCPQSTPIPCVGAELRWPMPNGTPTVHHILCGRGAPG